LFTVGWIKSAAAGIGSTRANEPFFRGDEPERSPSQPSSLRQGARWADATDILKTL
jgi:hypothetical protein